MTVNGKKVLTDFIDRHRDAASATQSWLAEVENASWQTPHDVKQRYPTVSIIPKHNLVFNIKGKQYRIWTIINFKSQLVLVKKAAKHSEYDTWQIG